jgi:DNA-directed RNA polymerase specialized sigma24 family protein
MRDKPRCHCHICKVERHLFKLLAEPPASVRFSTLALSSAPLARFSNVSELLADLHTRRNGHSGDSNAGELVSALICAGTDVFDSELIQSVLVLAFIPTIHRTYREVRTWFRDLEPDDVAQQIFAIFLQLATSVPTDTLNSHIAFVLSQALHRNAVRWARREQAKLLERDRLLEEQANSPEPIEQAQFESVTLLEDFLDCCLRKNIISEFERALLIKFKIEGFSAKEIQARHTVLSERAVLMRVHRIMQRLHNTSIALGARRHGSCNSAEEEKTQRTKKDHSSAKHFSLCTFSAGAAISKSRRQLSLDSSPTQSARN